jgi:hypothetical protein
VVRTGLVCGCVLDAELIFRAQAASACKPGGCSRASADPADVVVITVADRLPQDRHDGVRVVVSS